MADQSVPQATQLRLAFAPTPPSTIHVDLAGMTLLVDADVPESELFSYLASRDLEPEFRAGVGVSIPARRISDLAALPCRTIPTDALQPLWTLVTNPPPSALPATVLFERDDYLVSWESATGVPFDEVLAPPSAALLGFIDIPIVATDDVWARLERSLPTLGPSGTATWHPDGYVSISTSKPQILEASTIPGLFRTSPTTFGVCAAFADELARESGIRWVGHRPTRRRRGVSVPSHLVLAPHIRADLEQVVADIDNLSAKAVVWESGLGRRVLVLAALEVLDAYPATVLCTPQAIWLWRRHVDMVARTCGLTTEHADIQLITYHDLPLRRPEPQAFVFDDLASVEASAVWPALTGLAHLRDTIRIAIEDEWPTDPDGIRRLMEVLRPAEFRSTFPIAERYPVDPARRLREHVEVYLARRARAGTPELRAFRRSSVRTVSLSSVQQVAIAQASSRIGHMSPAQVLAEVLELVSAGPANAISPKLAAAAEIARTSLAQGRAVALLTRHRRTAQLLRAMLRPTSLSHVEAPPPFTVVPRVPVAVIRFEQFLPDLTAFDDVVVLDYPWSLDALDRCVGSAIEPEGPDVVVVHAANSVDDRIAVLAARRSELGDVQYGNQPLDASDIAYVLTPRL